MLNNITWVPPKTPSLMTMLSMGNDSLNPVVYGPQTAQHLLNRGDVMDLMIINFDANAHPFHMHGTTFQVTRGACLQLERERSATDGLACCFSRNGRDLGRPRAQPAAHARRRQPDEARHRYRSRRRCCEVRLRRAIDSVIRDVRLTLLPSSSSSSAASLGRHTTPAPGSCTYISSARAPTIFVAAVDLLNSR